MLRALAAILVVAFHVQTVFNVGNEGLLANWFTSGHRGVDLFFVISGFVIAYAHREDLGCPIRLTNFLYNRAARIYPAAWIMTAAAAIFYSLGFGVADKAVKLGPQAIFSSFFLLPQTGVPLVNVSWTLVYEVFFYCLFGLMILSTRVGLIALLFWQLTIIIAFMLNLSLINTVHYSNILCLNFGIGLLVAWLEFKTKEWRICHSIWLAALLIGTDSFFLGMALDGSVNYAGALTSIGSALIIIALLRLEQAGLLNVPDPIVTLGAASYSIYLVHFSLLQLVSRFMRRFGLLERDLLTLFLIGTGIISGLIFDRLVDRPIQRWLRRVKPVLLRST